MDFKNVARGAFYFIACMLAMFSLQSLFDARGGLGGFSFFDTFTFIIFCLCFRIFALGLQDSIFPEETDEEYEDRLLHKLIFKLEARGVPVQTSTVRIEHGGECYCDECIESQKKS